MSDEQRPLPADIWRRMMDGELTPRQASKEAAEVVEERRPFNDALRAQLAMSPKERELEQQDRLRARLWGARDQPRDEGGRFAPRASDDNAGQGGFDGGARGDLPARPSERQQVNDAIQTLIEHRGHEIQNLGGGRRNA